MGEITARLTPMPSFTGTVERGWTAHFQCPACKVGEVTAHALEGCRSLGSPCSECGATFTVECRETQEEK